MSTSKAARNNAADTRWMLGGDPPEPQTVERPTPPEVDNLRPGDTHTGTDPLGRAIGPRESHLHVKRVRDDKGEIVKPYTVVVGDDGKPSKRTIDTRSAEARAAKVADATGTSAEAVDEPTPILPADVAKIHGED